MRSSELTLRSPVYASTIAFAESVAELAVVRRRPRLVKPMFFILAFCALFLSASAEEPTSASERDWKRKLSTRTSKIGMSRSETEKLLGASLLAEVWADHGFDTLVDVYYQLDSRWCALIAYAPKERNADYSEAERKIMTLVVQPRVVPNYPGLVDELKKRSTSKHSN